MERAAAASLIHASRFEEDRGQQAGGEHHRVDVEVLEPRRQCVVCRIDPLLFDLRLQALMALQRGEGVVERDPRRCIEVTAMQRALDLWDRMQADRKAEFAEGQAMRRVLVQRVALDQQAEGLGRGPSERSVVAGWNVPAPTSMS